MNTITLILLITLATIVFSLPHADEIDDNSHDSSEEMNTAQPQPRPRPKPRQRRAVKTAESPEDQNSKESKED
ncbi:hypothetical protein Tcan_04637 [Toxocara canis]|uniref:Uncharacterized protein n=1 Tax=Toxocara canis TaxID=6265 RepID=A0A0B2VFE3_TOXCA|nr:hypothetical protein Tcan_04637 [Toxocara canis]